MIDNWLRQTVEYANWGYNAPTVAFIATLFFTVLSAWGLLKQAQMVWAHKSGKCIPVVSFVYFGVLSVTLFFYGLHIRSIAMMFSSLQVICFVPLLWGLIKFRGFTGTEKWLCGLFLLTIPAMIVVPRKDILIAVLLFGARGFSAIQPYEMLAAKSAGVVDIRMVAVFLATSVFWTIYGFGIGNWVLEVTNPIGFVITMTTALLWFRYRVRE